MSLTVAIGPSTFAEKDPEPLRMLEAAGVQVKPNPCGRRLTESEIIAHLQGVDGLIAGLEPLNRAVLQAAHPRLKALARVGIGVANVDFDAAREFGVRVSSTPEGPIDAVAEMTLAALLTLARGIVPANDALHHGEWAKSIGLGLRGATVLLVGCGRIGSRVAELLQAFGADVLAADPALNPDSAPPGVKIVSIEDGFQRADMISLHASGEACLLNANAFARMNYGVLLLNSARGGLVDESALLGALDSGKVKGAWFDAFWEEPYTGPLTRYPQVLLTPHTATYTVQCRRRMETDAVRNLLRDLDIAPKAIAIPPEIPP
ncbi:MAG: hydroxyacid dehydrogenase [Candidatus Hydrogenedentes bacterium]|nr:hydroxyacid dehydrogenase [Candidatus Hydrogenedentota bacterium]